MKEKGGDWKTANALPLKSGKAIELAVPERPVWPGSCLLRTFALAKFKTNSRRLNLYLTENTPPDQRKMPPMKGF
ncbi:MAG TPA: hypothetical protein VGW37_17230 [Terriglobia bacterium]|nr:hypothetical protein [Terriglobia bacterium]